jgi:hypothetical protein
MQEEIQQTYPTRPDLAPYGTLFCLLWKHHLGRLADQFDRDDDDYENAMDIKEYDENGNHKYTAMPYLRPGRKFLAGPRCKPILLNQCTCCEKVRACTRYRACAICVRNRCVCTFVKCWVEDCPNFMWRSDLFGDEEFDDEEYGCGCAFEVYPDDDDSDTDDDDSDNTFVQQMVYCQEHKPDGAQPAMYLDTLCMPGFWRVSRG